MVPGSIFIGQKQPIYMKEMKGGLNMKSIVFLLALALLIPFTIGQDASDGSLTSVEAVSLVPGSFEADELEDSINEVQDQIGDEERRVKFLRTHIGQGFVVDDSTNHLAFINLIWVKAEVISATDSDQLNVKLGGRLKVDKETYTLSLKSESDSETVLNLLKGEEIVGSLSLERKSTYDEGRRTLWTGEIKTPETNGEVTLVTVTRPVRASLDKASVRSADSTVAQDASLKVTGETKSEEKGFVGWFRRIFN